MSASAVLLFGHGSRDPAWRESMDAVARRIQALAPGTPVACAFLEMQPPDLAGALDRLVDEGATSVTVLPIFLGLGKHVREDLPRLVAAARERHPEVVLEVLTSAGERPDVIDLLAAAALRGKS